VALIFERMCNSASTMLFILDRANPLRTLEVRARAEVKVDEGYAFAEKLGQKYGMHVHAMDQPGEHRVIVTLHPVKINATDLSRG
jgi:hypothetical protein